MAKVTVVQKTSEFSSCANLLTKPRVHQYMYVYHIFISFEWVTRMYNLQSTIHKTQVNNMTHLTTIMITVSDCMRPGQNESYLDPVQHK